MAVGDVLGEPNPLDGRSGVHRGIRYTDVRQKLEVVSIHARKEPEGPCRHVSIHPKR